MRDHDDNDPTASAPHTSIRRTPSSDKRLAQAIRKLHEIGPRLVLQLEAEIEELRRQLGERSDTTGQPDEGRGAELVGMLRV